MTNKDFFDDIKEQSIIKSTIVSKYFARWSKIIKPTVREFINPPRMGYIDLFCGPGKYNDKEETISTPIRILNQIVGDIELSDYCVVIFNDMRKDYIDNLNNEIHKIDNIENLKFQPRVLNLELDDKILDIFTKSNEIPELFYEDKNSNRLVLIPSLVFIDPFGFLGITRSLIRQITNSWGCDLILFFNYNRYNMIMTNKSVERHVRALFGDVLFEEMTLALKNLDSSKREVYILEKVAETLQEIGIDYILPFKFIMENKKRTSHHIIFASKSPKGYEVMKEVMAQQSSTDHQGVPSLSYDPFAAEYPLLHAMTRPLDDLEELLLKKYPGRHLTMVQIYERHNVGTRYIKKNYKDVLSKMYLEGRITTDRKPARAGTFADGILVYFPK